MIYFNDQRTECIIHCSCGDHGNGDPHIMLRYDEHAERNWPPELNLYAQDGHQDAPQNLWGRLRNAWHLLRDGWPRWPGVMCMLGANEREDEVRCVRALAEWLQEKADEYEVAEAKWAARGR